MRVIRKIALLAVGDAAWQGGIQYIINIINAVNCVAKNNVEIVLLKNKNQHFFHLEDFTNVKITIKDIDKELPNFTFRNRVKWYFQRKYFDRINPRIENYLIKNNFDFSYPILASSCRNKLNTASWIADFQYHYFPEGANAKITKDAKSTISNIANKSKKIVYSSLFCMKDGFKLFPVTKGKTFAMPFTVYIQQDLLKKHNIEYLLEKYSLPQKFIMVSNLFAPTKNHKTLFNALGVLKTKGIEINLVCTGNIVDYRNQFYANEILDLLTKNKIRNQVHILGLIPREDQVGLYRLSIALVQPSVNEGWSTLVEEAKILGKRILLSNIALHFEQYPNNIFSFDSLNPEDLANKIELLLRETNLINFPELDAEKKAFENYQKLTIEFGNNFLKIASA